MDVIAEAAEASARPPLTRIAWRALYRIIPTQYPPIHLFEDVADADDWDVLAELEMRVNPRLRAQVGDIHLVPRERRVFGPGASVVMAPFCHVNPHGSRFSDGSYGVYYGASRLDTAIAEVAYHAGLFFARTHEPAAREDYRVLKGAIDARLHDLRGDGWAHTRDPDDYRPPRALGRALRDAGSDGVAFMSVRHAGGHCIGAFWPDVVALPDQNKHIAFHWDGARIATWFDYQTGAWKPVPA